jgi:hypothetical protein
MVVFGASGNPALGAANPSMMPYSWPSRQPLTDVAFIPSAA